jgi:SAM-dependent methyltransferase
MNSTETHWGSDAVDIHEKSLPGLKASFLVAHTPSQGRVVEIGCGSGKMLRTLKVHKPGLELFGFDVKDPHEPPREYTFQKMGDDVPAADASFDVVLIFDVLEHVPNPRHTLAEAARVLKPTGKLVAYVPVEGERLSFYELFRLLMGRDIYAQTKEHIQAFSHHELRALIEQYFDIEELSYAYHVLGHFMDAAFFAAQRASALRKFWWNDNVYYNPEKKKKASAASKALNGMLQLGNLVAWAESTALSRTRAGSAGILLEAVPRAPKRRADGATDAARARAAGS